MIIRNMTPQDAVAVAEIERTIFSQPWSAQGFLDSIGHPDTLFLVAECGQAIAGYIGMYQALDEGEITNVAVAGQFRTHGIGKALVAALLAEAAGRGITRVVLEVRVSNAAAVALYEKMGFGNIGIRKGFYDFPKEDAYIMEWNG